MKKWLFCQFYNRFYAHSKHVSANRTLPKNELSSKGPERLGLIKDIRTKFAGIPKINDRMGDTFVKDKLARQARIPSLLKINSSFLRMEVKAV